MESVLKQSRRIVVKVGSSLVTNQGQGLDHAALAGWAEQIAELKRMGKEVLLVSSGAIAEGMQRLKWKKRPHAVHQLQAAAAVGQMGLVQAYESCFRSFEMHAAQVLLTHEDLSDRKRYLNARSTLATLLNLNVIPVINENDTVATDEIRFGEQGVPLASRVGPGRPQRRRLESPSGPSTMRTTERQRRAHATLRATAIVYGGLGFLSALLLPLGMQPLLVLWALWATGAWRAWRTRSRRR